MARMKPCSFCDGEYESEYKTRRNGFCLWMEVYPMNRCIAFLAQANDEDGEMIEDYLQIEMNYCPVCGRKITEG